PFCKSKLCKSKAILRRGQSLSSARVFQSTETWRWEELSLSGTNRQGIVVSRRGRGDRLLCLRLSPNAMCPRAGHEIESGRLSCSMTERFERGPRSDRSCPGG